MKRRAIIVVVSLALVLLIAWRWMARDQPRSTADRLLLLVPDGTSFSDPKVTVWIDAGSEEGLHVVPVHDSEFLRPFLFPLLSKPSTPMRRGFFAKRRQSY